MEKFAIKKLKGSQYFDSASFEVGACVTFDGDKYNIKDFKPEHLNIGRSARGLSRLNRYYGHTHKPYSVAQHSVMMARSFMFLGDLDRALICLGHDIAENIVWGDIKSPCKRLLPPEVKEIEENVERVIAQVLGVEFPWDEEVMMLDSSIAQFEMTFMIYNDMFTDYWKPKKAERLFLETFRQIVYLKALRDTPEEDKGNAEQKAKQAIKFLEINPE